MNVIELIKTYIPYNKQLHILAGVFIAILCVLFGFINQAYLACFTAGLLKELYDIFIKKSTGDVVDLVATTAPGLLVTLYSLFME
jgi:cytochrome c oxidase assembly factor CtaG